MLQYCGNGSAPETGKGRALFLRASLTTLLALSASCTEPAVTERRSAEIAEDAAADYAARLEDRIAALESRMEDQERDIRGVRALGLENADNAEAIVSVINRNVKIENEAAVRRMTERGACGTRVVRLDNGGFLNERIPCTLADLRQGE